GGEDRRELRDEREGDELSGDAHGSVTPEGALGLDGQDGAGEEACQDDDRGRARPDAVHLEQDLAEIDRSREEIGDDPTGEKSVGLDFQYSLEKEPERRPQQGDQRIAHLTRSLGGASAPSQGRSP